MDGGVIEIYLCNASFPTIRGDPLEVIAFLSAEFLFFFFFGQRKQRTRKH